MSDEIRNGISRRAVLKSTAATAGVAAAISVGGFPTVWAQSCKELNTLTWEGYAEDEWVTPFEETHGADVNPLYIATPEEQLAKVRAGGGELYDVMSVSTDNTRRLIEAGGVAPLDESKLEHLDQILPFLTDRYRVDGKLYAVPFTWDVNPFIYNIDAFKELGLPVPPTSMDILWDPRLKNKIAVWDETSTLFIAANVLGIDKDPDAVFDMTDEQLDQVLRKLIELKPNIRKLWTTGGEAIDLFASGEVIAGLAWSYIYNEVKKRGVNIGTVVFPNHGAHGWVDGYGLTPGRPECEDMAYAYINHITSPEVMYKVSQHVGYAPANQAATEYMDKETIEKFHLDSPEEFAEDVIIKVDRKRPAKYLEILNEFKAAPAM